MGRTGAGLYLSQAAEMTVWFYANQILQALSQIHTSFFFCISALGPHVGHFPSCFKSIMSDRTVSLISPWLVLAEGCGHHRDALLRKTRISPARPNLHLLLLCPN